MLYLAEVVVNDDDGAAQFWRLARIIRRRSFLAYPRLGRSRGRHLGALAGSFSVGHTLHAPYIQELVAFIAPRSYFHAV